MNWQLAMAAAGFLVCAGMLVRMAINEQRKSREAGIKRVREEKTHEELSYAGKWIRWIETFEKSRSNVQVLFDKHALSHGVYLESRAPCEDLSLLFVMHDEKKMDLLVQAIERILADDRLPKHAIGILLTDSTDGMAECELACRMREEKRTYDICLSDRQGVGAGGHAYIGVKRKAMMHLRQSPVYIGDKKEYLGIDPLSKQVRHYLTWTERLEFYIPYLRKTGIETLCRLVPSADRFFASRCIVTGEDIIISATKDDTAEKALSKIRREATKKHCSLSMFQQYTASRPADKKHCRIICDIVKQTLVGVKPICILYDETCSMALEKLCHSVILFAPTGAGFADRGAVDFYADMLMHKMKQ